MSAAMYPLKIGLIGAGMVSAHHLRAWAGIAEATVVAIADPDIARAQECADAFGIEAVYDDAARLLAAQACDAVDIAAPVEHHRALCELAADHGVAILCQKPLAASHDEAIATVDAVGGRVRFMVHENWRFRASYRTIRACLDAGLIGEVTGARLSVTSSGLVADQTGACPALTRQPFLANLPRLLVFEVLIHHIDVLRWLFGDLSVRSATLSRHCDAVCGEDTAAIVFATAGGLDIALGGSLVCPEAPPGICDHLTITGTQGVIRLSDTALTIEGCRPERFDWSAQSLYASAFEGALRHFADRLVDGGAFETEADDNLTILRLVDEVYRVAGLSGPTTRERS